MTATIRPPPLLLHAEGPVPEEDVRRGAVVLALTPDGGFVAMTAEDYLARSPRGCTLGLGYGSWTTADCPRYHMQEETWPGSGRWRCEDPLLARWRRAA